MLFRPAANQESIFTIREAPAGNAGFQTRYTFKRDGAPTLNTE